MSVKMIALDMDGTLLDSKKRLPKDFIPWVKSHPDIKIVIASGRQYYMLEKDFWDIKDDLYYIAENGSLVFRQGNIIHANCMAKEDVLFCIDYISKNIPEASMILCGTKSAYILEPDGEFKTNAYLYYAKIKVVEALEEAVAQDDIAKFALFFNNNTAEKYVSKLTELPKHLGIVLSGTSWIDVANKGINKGVGIKALQEHLQISPDECMAFGDYPNDLELLQNCTESYCMANGHPEVMKIAKYIADTNDNDGVMKVLRSM